MKKITYKMELLSSLIVSPRAGQAFYYGVDPFCRESVLAPLETDEKDKEAVKVKVVYPFYQYGEYGAYDPEHAEYYLPGSSVKGALLQKNEKKLQIKVDDVPIGRDKIVLRNLVKAQYVDQDKEAVFAPFFNNVGVEMVKAETVLKGELYLEDDEDFKAILKSANKATKKKVKQMLGYLEQLTKIQYKNKDFSKELSGMMEALTRMEERKDIILVGGYKGLLHSILLRAKKKGQEQDHNQYDEDRGSGIFLDRETKLPHGFVSIQCESEERILL